MDDLERFCCQNPECSLYGRRDAGNLSVCARYGKQDHIRLLYCKACKDRFSERKGTPCSTPICPRTRPTPCSSTSAKDVESDRPNAWSATTATASAAWRGWSVNTPTTLTTSSWLFPPRTREVQFDEMWSFVAKKQKNCDPTNPSDDHKGDWWDHVAYDPEHKLVLTVVPGARVIENVEEVVAEVKGRLGDQAPALMTSDGYAAYEEVIATTFSEVVLETPRGPDRRPLLPEGRLDRETPGS
jgi:hypothetical protein